MTGIRLNFFKLNVDDMDAALAFWRAAFGFTVTMTFDEPAFIEHGLALPGQETGGPSLMLVRSKSGTPVTVGTAHGPIGLLCDDIASAFAKAVECGAQVLLEPVEAGGALVAMLKSPQGHEVELVQLPA